MRYFRPGYYYVPFIDTMFIFYSIEHSEVYSNKLKRWKQSAPTINWTDLDFGYGLFEFLGEL